MRFAALLSVVCLYVLAVSPAQAQDQPPAAAPPDPLALCEAYQVGFLQVVAVACYQLYSSTGIIATDYANGYVDEATARFALSENALLLSACTAGVLEVSRLTPPADSAATAELGRLAELLSALGTLITSLDQLLDNPTDEQAQSVESARIAVEQLLDSYATTGE